MRFGKVTGIILAGGKSSRFGTDKALYVYKGKRMIDYALEVLRPVCDEIIISTNKPEDICTEGVTKISDIYSGCGPLGGIHACLLHSQTQHNIIIGCDMPGLHSDLISTLLNHKSGYQVVIPVHVGMKETMACYFNKNSASVLEEALKNGLYKISDAIKPLLTLFLNVENMPFYSEKLFTNINTKEEINRLIQSGL